MLAKVKNNAKRLSCTVQIGYFDNKQHENSKRAITVRQIATFHEFGTKRMPKRAFIRPALNKNKIGYLAIIAKHITPILLGKEHNLGVKIGTKAVKDIQDYILQGNFTPIRPITAKRKGTTIPLIETRQMYDDIDYRIKE